MAGLLTNSLVARSRGLLELEPEVSAPLSGFEMFNGGSVEAEVGEFLYGLVRVTKPQFILETGTHAGVSAAYMAQALKDNQSSLSEASGYYSSIATFEYDSVWVERARTLYKTLDLTDWVEVVENDVRNIAEISIPIDLAFLDSEPEFRYDELVRFFPAVKPGGFILVHDLHRNMSYGADVNPDHPHLGRFWPYGDFREKLGDLLLDHELEVVPFPTPRGFTMFYKPNPRDNAINYKKGAELIV